MCLGTVKSLWIKGCHVMIQTREHCTVRSHWSAPPREPEHIQTHLVWLVPLGFWPGRAAQTPQLQGKPYQLAIIAQLVDNSPSVLAITSPARYHLHLAVQQEVLVRTSFPEKSCLHKRNLIKWPKESERRNLSPSLGSAACQGKLVPGLSDDAWTWHAQHLKGHKICSLHRDFFCLHLI